MRPLLHSTPSPPRLEERGLCAPRSTHISTWSLSRGLFPTRLMVQILMADTVLSTPVSVAVLAGTLDGQIQSLALLLHDALGNAVGPLITKLALGLLADRFQVLIQSPAF